MYDENGVYMGEGFFGEAKGWETARKIAGVVIPLVGLGVSVLVLAASIQTYIYTLS